MKTIPATKASQTFGELLDTSQHEPIVITRKKRPVSVIMSVREADRLFKMLVEAGIQRGLDDVEAGRYTKLTPEYGRQMLEQFEADYQKQKAVKS